MSPQLVEGRPMRSDLTVMSEREILRLQVMQQLGSGNLSQADAAAQLGLCVRQVKRLLRRYREHGAKGLVSQKRGRPSNHRTDPALLARALAIVANRYADFGPTLASEKLAERDQIRLPKETLRTAMIAAGLWKPRRSKRGKAHPPRERRACFGELVQIDGSHHRWFEQRGPKCTLLVFVDDATSALLGLRFDVGETTVGYFGLVAEYLRNYGKPIAFYSDRFGVFRVNQTTSKSEGITQFGRAMHDLDIESICANSPQAKGRVERANRVLQDRLVKELRLEGISTIEKANAFVPDFIARYNRRFAVEPRSKIDAHRPIEPSVDLDRILCSWHPRIVSKNLTVQFGSSIFEIIESAQPRRLQHARVIVLERQDGTIVIERDGQTLPFRTSTIADRRPKLADAKAIAASNDSTHDRRLPNPKKGHRLPPEHPWTTAPRRRSEATLPRDILIGPDGDILALR
jgi:transposase